MTSIHINVVLYQDLLGLYHLVNKDNNTQEGIGKTINAAERDLLDRMDHKDIRVIDCVLIGYGNNVYMLDAHKYSH